MVTVKGVELKELALQEYARQKEKANLYKQQLEAFKSIQEAPRTNDSRQTPKEAIEQKIKEHTIKADYINFVSSHLVDTEEYLLSESDLIKVGVIRNVYF